MQHRSLPLALTGLCAAAALALSASVSSPANEQRTFATAREAAHAMLAAAEADDVPALLLLLGPEGKDVIRSGDPVEDKNNRAKFVDKAKQSLQVKINARDESHAIILIGADDYPFPIPLTRSAGRWHFDTPTGREEILARRIGSNELDAIAACNAYVDAQYDYATEDRNKNGVPEYARKLISSPGQRDGLFWPESDAPPTKFAAGVNRAMAEGYRKQNGTPTPHHGYYFRILMAQGPNAADGAIEYVQHNSMIGGFGLVAWPAEYGVSGIKTFIVNQDRVIYDKDLGPSTTANAEAIATFNPDRTWSRVR